MMREIELTAGTIEYQDTGGGGPVVVLLHGLVMDASLWDGVISQLGTSHRCVVPVLPLGAHRLAMPKEADLSVPAQARMVEELMERLDLRDVTLVGNDTGGAIAQLILAGGAGPIDGAGPDGAGGAGPVGGAARVGGAVLASCDAFDNFPPGLTGRTLVLTGKLPPWLFGLFMQQMRIKPLRRLPIAFGWLTRRGDAATAGWMQPILHDRGVRRDAVKVLRSISGQRDLLVDVAGKLPAFDRPAAVVWAEGDRVMPPEHGRRLAQLLPQARLVEVADSATLIPLDQPAALADVVREVAARVGPVDPASGHHGSASAPKQS